MNAILKNIPADFGRSYGWSIPFGLPLLGGVLEVIPHRNLFIWIRFFFFFYLKTMAMLGKEWKQNVIEKL